MGNCFGCLYKGRDLLVGGKAGDEGWCLNSKVYEEMRDSGQLFGLSDKDLAACAKGKKAIVLREFDGRCPYKRVEK